MNVLIVEDEIKTARSLQKYLVELRPDITILALLQSVEESIDFLQTHEAPDLIFMDIELADGSSFDIFKETEVTSLIIFCTAYNQYALDAFKVNSIDYILKPFDKQMVSDALNKVDNLIQTLQKNTPDIQMLASLIQQSTSTPSYKKSFLVFHKHKYIPVQVHDIACFYVNNNTTCMYTFSGEQHPLDYSLDQLQQLLDDKIWYRANRQFLIPFSAIKEVEHYFARKLLVQLTIASPEKIIISKARASHFMQWMNAR